MTRKDYILLVAFRAILFNSTQENQVFAPSYVSQPKNRAEAVGSGTKKGSPKAPDLSCAVQDHQAQHQQPDQAQVQLSVHAKRSASSWQASMKRWRSNLGLSCRSWSASRCAMA